MDPLPSAIVLSDAKWHPGVVGLVASRLVERFYRPSLVLGSTDGKFRGSGRSTHALDLFSVLNSVRENFVAFGGHFHAVGLTLMPEKIEWLTSFMNTEAALKVSAADHVKPLDIDAQVSLENFDYDLLTSMETLEPFGVGNPRPRWLVRNAQVLRVKRIGKDQTANHARVLLTDGTADQWLTAFGMAPDFESALSNSHSLDVIVDGRMQIWNGEPRPELRLLDCSVRRTI
jgi:single-stranded-DNA-specific exonuclease